MATDDKQVPEAPFDLTDLFHPLHDAVIDRSGDRVETHVTHMIRGSGGRITFEEVHVGCACIDH